MVFEPTLAEMEDCDSLTYGPTSFRDHVSKNDLDVGSRTPRYISIDSLSELATEQREAEAMALRMGSGLWIGYAVPGRGSPDRLEAALRERFAELDSS